MSASLDDTCDVRLAMSASLLTICAVCETPVSEFAVLLTTLLIMLNHWISFVDECALPFTSLKYVESAAAMVKYPARFVAPVAHG